MNLHAMLAGWDSQSRYIVLAFALGLGLLWGYALLLWRSSWALKRRRKARHDATLPDND